MTNPPAAVPAAGADAALAALLLSVDPSGLGGAVLRAAPGAPRDQWLAALRARLPAGAPFKRVPLHITDERLLGGLDLATTLRTGRRALQRGLLAEADGGVVVLAMAERVTIATAARLAAVLDSRSVTLERDGLAARIPAAIALVALDEGIEPDERAPAVLLERLAFHLDLAGLDPRAALAVSADAAAVAAARLRLPSVALPEDLLTALVTTAAALGVHSARASWFALRASCALAALRGAGVVGEADAAIAARLVLAPRATRLPAAPEDERDETDEPAEAEPPTAEPAAANDEPAPPPQALDESAEVVLAAARAAIPAGLLAQLQAGLVRRPQRGAAGRAGALRGGALRGRPVGIRAGLPERGARLDLVETLRAAAPWQPVRRRAAAAAGDASARRVRIEGADFRIRRFKERSETTTIFVVDASGSSALHRLAEAKGAVELLLADCYVRRDRVAVVAFRGRGADVLLPPTRSLVRAKRSLAGLPGGGGTPLAAGLDAALAIADAVQRRGGTAVLVLLTDGRANIARDAAPGRGQAEADALQSARGVLAAGLNALLIDTSPRPQPFAAQLAGEMHARYFPLPHADAAALNRAVRLAATATS